MFVFRTMLKEHDVWKLALKSRDGRHLAADCYECKTSKQFFKIKYRLPLMKKLFLAKCQK